jgi:hypothetical protein
MKPRINKIKQAKERVGLCKQKAQSGKHLNKLILDLSNFDLLDGQLAILLEKFDDSELAKITHINLNGNKRLTKLPESVRKCTALSGFSFEDTKIYGGILQNIYGFGVR